MQRWFFADEAAVCDTLPPPSSLTPGSSTSHVTSVAPRAWQFCVLYNRGDLLPNEVIGVVGNCEVLGNWLHTGIVRMHKEFDGGRDGGSRWSVNLDIPREQPCKYRYVVCAVDPTKEQTIVRRWEPHRQPRIVPESIEQPRDQQTCDIFGDNGYDEKVDRGWLTSETIVQLKFVNAPFSWKQRMKRRLVYVKVTPMNLRIPNGCENNPVVALSHSTSTISQLEESLSNDTHDHDTRENGTDPSTAFAFNEVVTLRPDDCEIRQQPQFGTACQSGEMVVFHLTLGDFESTAYLIDLYSYSSKAALDEPPYHLGYHYVLPNLFKRSEGGLEVPITCASKHRPMGMMKVGYLIVRPTPSLPLDMSVTYERYWNPRWQGLDVGHRGTGVSFKTNNNCNIRENTIHSLRKAAEHGADMVEFDVQLSKDLVPVVYHDFKIYVSLNAKNSSRDFLELPLRQLTLEQLKNLKVYHTVEGRSGEARCFDDEHLMEHQPFPQLADVLDCIDPSVGFNIEIKWSQRLHDGSMEEEFEEVVDRNLYVDCILDVIFRKAKYRRIVLSSFDPDICTMLRYKQNRYPVMFLTIGVTDKYEKFMDPRGNNLDIAAFNAVAMELLGIVAHTEDLLRDPGQVNLAKNRGLIIFCWGDDNNDMQNIKMLKHLGLHAIIYDRMDMLNYKEVKKSVFLLEATDSQRDLIKLQALEMGHKWHNETDQTPVPHK